MLKAIGRPGYVLASLVLLLAATPLAVWADPTTPGKDDRFIIKSITSMVRREHLLKHPIDDEISARFLSQYLKALDPWKLYFYQSDIDNFERLYKTRMDDTIEAADESPAFAIYKVFLSRVDERLALIETILNEPLDFTQDDEMVVDKESSKYPVNEQEARDKWIKRIKYDELLLKSDKTEGTAAIDKLRQRYRSFSKRMHQTDSQELLEIYMNCLTSSFDPHTNYMAPLTLEDFQIAMRLQLEGIGVALQPDDGYATVKEIIPGGAADKDGRIKPEDRIVAVGQGAEGPMEDVMDLKLRDVVKLIRGKEGTVVRLAVVSAGSTERKIYRITRAKIELTDQEAHGQVFEVSRGPGGANGEGSGKTEPGANGEAGANGAPPYKIGVIDLPSFYMDMEANRRGVSDFRSSTRDVHKILDDFKKQGVDAVVLDLRRNGGGSLTEAISLTGLFIPEGPVVQVKDSDGQIRPFYDFDESMVWGGPLVVLTSKFSASASEILAGAIQDYGRGLIVGDHSTHGKGTVQSLLDLSQQYFPGMRNTPALGAIKITMQQFYRPDGDSTQTRGVLADVELPSIKTHLDVGEADLDYPVAFDKVDALGFKRMNFVTPAICDELRRRSEQRCVSSDDFKKVERGITRYLEQKKRKSVSLNEEKFMKERAEIDADKEEEKAIDDTGNGKKHATIERDYYLNEVLAIATDYLNLRQLANTRTQVQGGLTATGSPR